MGTRWTERPYPAREGVTHYACAWCHLGFLARQDIEEHQRTKHRRELAELYPVEPDDPEFDGGAETIQEEE